MEWDSAGVIAAGSFHACDTIQARFSGYIVHSQMHSKLRFSLLVCLSLLATASLAQTTINVGPGQTYTTIQSGIDAANNGDTVLVAPGTYNENIDFKGKAITVTSSGGAASTTIDGGNKPGIATVTFANGETNASVISGFTIRGGGDTIFAGTSDGGVFVDGASPTIQNNTITANYCHDIHLAGGAATILNNEISGALQSTNETGPDQSYCSYGGGIFLYQTSNSPGSLGPVLIGNTIENNITTGSNVLSGSAISLWAAPNVLIMNNTIRNNISPIFGSAVTSANSENTVIVQNLIYGNTSSCGGALQFANGGPGVTTVDVLIANNTMVDNVMTSTLGGDTACAYIAQIYPSGYSYGLSGPSVIIANNIIGGSTSYPAVNCSWYAPPSLEDQPTFENNILYNAGGPFFGSYCVDVSGEDGNIAVDPQFVNPAAGDYHLKSTSPAIDSGLNSVQQTFQTLTGLNFTKDFDGNARVQNGSAKGCIIDMGAYEYPATTDDCGVLETLTSFLNPAFAGQSVTFTAQLSDSSGTPTGTVQFLDGTTVLATQLVSGTGSATFTTSSLSVGSHTITANYQPTGVFSASTASLVEVINADPTSTALTCLPSPIDISGTAQLTATVASAYGTPTGSVSFTDNGTALATNPLAAGTTSLMYTGSAAGTHSIMATYAPTGSFAASSATCSEVVNPIPTTSTLTVTPPISTYGSPVMLSATVSPATPPGPSTPTGTVTFYNGTATLGTAQLVSGIATLSNVSFPGGSYSLTCAYGGSAVYATSRCNPVPLVVNPAPTALTLTSSSNPASYLSSVTFTVGLTTNGQPAGAGNAIQLSVNSQIVSLSTNTSGVATYTIATLTPGSYPVAATFSATNNLQASSAALTEVISAAPTSITLTGAPNPGDLNQPVTLTATVSSQSSPVGSGTVTFYDGATPLGTSPLSGGVASLTASFTTVGVHSLTAVYAGNTDFSTSTSAVFQETIQAGDFAISVAPSAADLYTGQAATMQVSVTALNGFNQPLALSCSGLPANTTCVFTPAALPSGQGTATLTIQTTAPHETTAASLSVVGLLALLLLPGWKSRRSLLARLGVVALAIGMGIGLTGCASTTPITGGTPPNTYQVAVTATTSGPGTPLTHSAVVTLTVKSLF